MKQISGGLAGCDRRDELAKQLVVGAETESRDVIVEGFLAVSGALTQNSPRQPQRRFEFASSKFVGHPCEYTSRRCVKRPKLDD